MMMNWIRGVFSRNHSAPQNLRDGGIPPEPQPERNSRSRIAIGIPDQLGDSFISDISDTSSSESEFEEIEVLQKTGYTMVLEIIYEGKIWRARFNESILFSELKQMAIAHFVEAKEDQNINSKYKLISLSRELEVLPPENTIHGNLYDHDKILLVANKLIGFETSVNLTLKDIKGPSNEEIIAATANLSKKNSIVFVPSFGCQESFQSEIRKVLYSLVEASAKILAQTPDAKLIFDQIAEKINSKNKKEIDKYAVKYLKDLGFTEVQARYALRLKRNRQVEAMEWLLENSHRVKEQYIKNLDEASTSRFITSSSITQDNPIHIINQLLQDIQDFHFKHFDPNPKALDNLQEMGFTQDEVFEALCITGNNQVAACEWLCGERGPSVTQTEAGLDPEGPLYKALMRNPTIQLGLHNPKIMLSFLSILENPTSANLWLNDMDCAPVMAQVFKTYHSEKHIMMVNQQMELIKKQ